MSRRSKSRQSSRVTSGAVSSPVAQHPGSVPGLPRTSYSSDTVDLTNTTISSVDNRNWFTPNQPILPFAIPGTKPREWDYGVGTNLDMTPARLRQYRVWRQMARTWGVLRTIIETRKDQLLALPWEIQVRNKPKQQSRFVDELRQFFRKPDGKKRYNPWARMLLEDLFVIDAPTLYVGHRDLQGRPLMAEVFDGSMIKVLVDDAGRIPDWPNPAYQHIVKGLPFQNFDERELIYSPMRPQPEMPIYGNSPVQQIEIELTEAIRKTYYQLGFWVEGTLPDMIMSVPKEWTARQIADFQAMFDSQLSGNLREKSKVRFVPEGMKPYDVKNSGGEGLSSHRDEVLIRLACYAFSVSPSPFIQSMNRATAQASQEEAKQEGLQPLMMWWKDDIMDRIIQDEFGYDDVEFVHLPIPELDHLKRSQVYMNLVKTALMSPNEVRDEMGRQPVDGGDDLVIFTNNGVMTLADAIQAGKNAAVAGIVGADGKPMVPAPSSSVPKDGTRPGQTSGSEPGSSGGATAGVTPRTDTPIRDVPMQT